MSSVLAQLAPRMQTRPRRTDGIVVSAMLAALFGAALLGGAARERSSAAPVAHGAGLSQRELGRLPTAALGPISAAVGADRPAYRVGAEGSGFSAASPGQRLRLRFERSGVVVRSGGTSVALSLRAVGYGASMRAIPQVAPRGKDNRVLYSPGGLSEWYVNGPLGLEQGFTIARAPSGPVVGPLTLSIALAGDAHASLASRGQSITLRGLGGPMLRYGGLTVTDARGRALHSWIELDAGRILLRVQTRGARYPLRIDPFIRQGEKLIGTGLSGPYGYLGMSVALSADGNTALVGGPADDNYVGAAWVFTRSGSTWTQQGEKLIGTGSVGGAWFGQSVALSADGDTALIGGPNDNHEVGAAWVFTRSGSTWTQQGSKITGGTEESGEGYFGRSVALSATGATALIGGYNDNEHRGGAWVFTRSGSTWTQQGKKLTGSGELGFFGWSVALSSSANTAVIGEWGLGGGVGGAWVFTRSGSTWKKQGGELVAGGASGDSWFGYSVALSADGNTALVGGPQDNSRTGAVWVFTRTGATWSQQGEKLTGTEEVGEGELGYSVALSAGGDTALAGGRVDSDFHGAAWAFERTGSVWVQQGTKLTGGEETANREEFGWSVALSAGGNTALSGSPCDKACVGSASMFVNGSSPEFGRCEKVAAGTGAYTSSNCTTLGSSNGYEWLPGVGKAGFTTKLTTGSFTLESAVKTSKLTCTGETSAGEYTGAKTVGGVVVTLTGCERAAEKCSSAGAAAGEIVTNALEGTLGVEAFGATSAADKIALELFPVTEAGPVMEFSCAGTALSVRGSVIVPVASEKMLVTDMLKARASGGKQKPESFAGGPKEVLEESVGGAAYEQAGVTATITQTSEEGVEVNSVI